MCGIAGYFGPGEVDTGALLARLRHRGPDAHGVWSKALSGGTRLQLVHTRLKIIDLSEASAQPMRLQVGGAGEADGLVLVFNGEIYNFPALRAELAAAGHRFVSPGDTEVLLHGYAEWGTEVFARLDGMFAVAIYDGPRRRLVVARDHAGIKPLYFTRTRDGGMLFASEVRAITGTGLTENRIDRVALADYLRFGSCQEPRTLVDGVRAFPPGHFGVLRLDEGVPAALVTRPYWLHERQQIEPAANAKQWLAEHRDCLAETVREQMVSDVPLGVFLSGGIDSTLLMEMAAASGKDKIVAFTLAGKLTEFNEGAIAMESARRAGVHHLLVQLNDDEVGSWVRDGLGAMDLPSSDGMNTYLVSRAARKEGLVAVLAGTGADELHGAYGHARSLARLIATVERAGPLRRPLSRLAIAGFRVGAGPVAAERLASLLGAVPSAWQVDLEKRRFFTLSQIGALWPGGVGLSPGWSPPYADEASFAAQGAREQIRLTELRGYLLNTLLRDCDWATMANQQELRVPFLGRRYMECVLRAPERMTAAEGGPKPRLAALLTPEARRLATLPKRGFTMDYVGWLTGPLEAELVGAAAVLRDTTGFDFDARARLDALRISRSQKDARRVWALLALGRYIEANQLTGLRDDC